MRRGKTLIGGAGWSAGCKRYTRAAGRGHGFGGPCLLRGRAPARRRSAGQGAPARRRAAGTVDAAGGVGLARVRRWAARRERGAEAPVGGLLQPGRPLGAGV